MRALEARLSAQAIPPHESGNAHLGTKRVWTSDRRKGDRYRREGHRQVRSAAGERLRRPRGDHARRGFDPEHNEWEFVEYTRETANARFALTASGTVCWSCHVGTVETDYVWIETRGLAR
jgi:hypothetical protein